MNANGGEAPRPGVRPLEYPIATRALAQWAAFDLRRRAEPGGRLHFTLRHVGSTCSNAGTPIESWLHAVLRPAGSGWAVENAWIEIDPEDEGHRRMCVWPVVGKRLYADLRRPPAFCGRGLEEAIAGLTEVSPAGCLCTEATINHKWRQMLCTVHYALSRETPPA